MPTLEYWQRKEKEAKDELDKANAALKSFQESKYGEGKLNELRERRRKEPLMTERGNG